MAEIKLKKVDRFSLAENLKKIKGRGTTLSILLLIVMMLNACAFTQAQVDISREVQIPKEAAKTPITPPRTQVAVPDFVPVREDLSPMKMRIVDISARGTALRDILYIIAEATGLNLVLEKEVDPDIPVTITLKNVTAEDALNAVSTTVDYFYTIKNNMLLIKATESKNFELGHPSISQTYSSSVGGDILGSAGAGGATNSSLKGNISQTTTADATAYNFWDVIEKSIDKILTPPKTAPAAPAATTSAASSGNFPPGSPASAQTGVSASAARAPANESFSINRVTGTIIVSATKKNLEKVENYIESVKRVINRQVVIEAKIIEVNLNDSFGFGVDWNLIGNFRDSQMLSISQGSVTAGSFGAYGLSPAVGALSILTTRTDFTSMIRALQTQGEIRSLANPRINVMNGQTALIGAGRNQAYISKVDSTTTTGTPPVTTYTVTTSNILSGNMIGIIPYISENGEISLTVTPVISNLLSMSTVTVGGTTGTSLQLPTVDVREMTTTIKVRNGQMVAIGGLIQKNETLTDSFIPFLGKIPILGWFFKARAKSETKTELVILLQPTIVLR